MLQIFDVVIRSVRSRHGGRSLRFWTEGIADPIPERETALAIQEIAGRVAVWPALALAIAPLIWAGCSVTLEKTPDYREIRVTARCEFHGQVVRSAVTISAWSLPHEVTQKLHKLREHLRETMIQIAGARERASLSADVPSFDFLFTPRLFP